MSGGSFENVAGAGVLTRLRGDLFARAGDGQHFLLPSLFPLLPPVTIDSARDKWRDPMTRRSAKRQPLAHQCSVRSQNCSLSLLTIVALLATIARCHRSPAELFAIIAHYSSIARYRCSLRTVVALLAITSRFLSLPLAHHQRSDNEVYFWHFLLRYAQRARNLNVAVHADRYRQTVQGSRFLALAVAAPSI